MARTSLTTLLAAAALGAAAMYVLDPDKGRRRRAIGRDKLRSAVGNARRFVNVAARDAGARFRGMRALARRPRTPLPDDLQLIERVRARIGRVVSHPHSIQVGAHHGQVMLSGHVLASEVGPLLDTVRAVWGVEEVEEHLVVHESADHVPSLQGGVPRGIRPDVLEERWPPAGQLAAVAGGGLLALYGLRNRSLAGCLLAAIGAAMAVRGSASGSGRSAAAPQARVLIPSTSSDARPVASID
jgi:hypothetical protein